MKRILISTSLLLITFAVSAQDNLQQLLESVEANNTTLKAYREQADANMIGNKTGLTLSNPEIEFEHAWGKPKIEGKEINFNVSQSFDFPTVYKNRSKLSDEQNKQVDLVYQDQLGNILQEARLLYIDLVYAQKKNKELSQRHSLAKELSEAYQKLFDEGSINILERNKTRLNFLTVDKALDMNNVDIEALLTEIRRMNGGEPLIFTANSYPNYGLPLDFEQWYVQAAANNPALRMTEQNVVISEKDEQLTRSMNLPKLSAGYISEYTKGASQHGFSVGMSIPLWEGRNTVKHKKAQTNALRFQQIDAGLQFKNQLRKEYDKAGKLTGLLKDYKEILSSNYNNELLKKGLDQGQLSLINYLLEMEVLYDTVDSYLDTEKDYQIALAELMQWDD